MSDKISFSEAMKKALHLGGTLFAVTAVTGLLLGIVQDFTQAAIMKAEQAARNEAFKAVMPDADNFEKFNMTQDEVISDIQKGTGKSGLAGWCISVNSKGYGGIVSFIVGITKDGSIKAISILNHSETPGLGARSTEPEFYTQFNDKDKLPLKVAKGAASSPEEIIAITGATITSTAIVDGVNYAHDYWSKNLKGAE